MKNLVAWTALAAWPWTTALAAAPFTAADLVRLERVSEPRLSADGRLLAWQQRSTDLEANRGTHSLWLVDLADATPEPVRVTAARFNSTTPRWTAGGRLYFLSDRSGRWQVWRSDLGGKPSVQVTNLPLDVHAFRVAPDGRGIALAIEAFPECPDLACTRERLDVRAGSPETGVVHDRLFVRHWDRWRDGRRGDLVHMPLDPAGDSHGNPVHLTRSLAADVPTRPFGDDGDFLFTADGASVIFVARHPGRDEAWSTNLDLWQVRVDGADPPRNLTPTNPATDTGPVLSPDGRRLAWRAMARAGYEADRHRILVRDLESGETTEVAATWDRSPTALAWTPDGQGLFATADDQGQRPLFAIRLQDGQVRRLTDEAHVGAFAIGSDAIVVSLDSLRFPPRLVRLSADGAQVLADPNAALLAARELGTPEAFRFTGAQGDPVTGYVVRPAEFEEGRTYPVAFIVHGGPQASFLNLWHTRWNAQTWAGAGYAVVLIDFHGSTGYGQAFTDSIRRDWGGKPLKDLQLGWAFVKQQFPFLDGDRACALGASYGGYMVNWIAGQWPAFRCLVNHDGILDLRAFHLATEELWFPEWEFDGTPWAAPELHERHNPVAALAHWKTPMLVIHGGQDFRIPLEQGLAAFTALQRRGIDSRLIVFPDENHWVLKPHNSLQWHREVEAWLERWLSPPAP